MTARVCRMTVSYVTIAAQVKPPNQMASDSASDPISSRGAHPANRRLRDADPILQNRFGRGSRRLLQKRASFHPEPLVVLRSQFILSGSATLVASPGFAVGSSTVEQAIEAIAAVERKARARIGLTVLRPHGSLVIGHRAQERFPLVSTQKLAVVMTLLARRDFDPNHVLRISKADFDSPDFSYISQHYPNGGTLRLEDICALTISQSDNTGADVLAHFVDPHTVTAYLQSLGVADVRIDRTERELPDKADDLDPRNTGTPQAMAIWYGASRMLRRYLQC